jgi:glycosyltransferase involved in cell wall biosynthesis
MKRPRVLFVVNADWFFLSHRLPLALAARDAGAEVIVAAADTGRAAEIESAGIRFLPLQLSRKGIGPLSEARTVAAIYRLYRAVRPDLVHHVTIKPVLYGSIAARVAGVGRVVNALSGLGYVFSGSSRNPLLRRAVEAAYRFALRHPGSRTIFQNLDDRRLFVSRGLVDPERTVLIRGSGVNCSRFSPLPEPAQPLVMLPARMLRDKGVEHFVEAARAVREAYPDARFVLVGPADRGNPTGVPEATLRGWAEEGVAEWWGEMSGMENVLPKASVVVLPSRREGLPKVLLEAAACGRPIVTTDVPGCREVVVHGENGFLVPWAASAELARSIVTLLASSETRERFGAAGRTMVEREFAEEIVVSQTMSLYAELLGDRWPATRERAA